MDGLTIQHYAVAISKITEPINIQYISRISHARVCLFLSSKKLADDLSSKQVTIGEHLLEIRPLLTKTKRVMISNVYPNITPTAILEELKKLGIVPVSSITEIKAAINIPGLSHIKSFRRQMYIKDEDIPKIQGNIQVGQGNNSHWIYFSMEKFFAKKKVTSRNSVKIHQLLIQLH